MPIYEYECRKCKAHTEAFQKVSDKPLTKCPKCGGRLDKRISAPAIQFKGSGWYVTDYGRNNGKSEAKSASDSGSAKNDAVKKDSKGESKQAPAKTESSSSSSSKSDSK